MEIIRTRIGVSLTTLVVGFMLSSCGGETISNEEIDKLRDSLETVIASGEEFDNQISELDQQILEAELVYLEKEAESYKSQLDSIKKIEKDKGRIKELKDELDLARSAVYEHRIKRLNELKSKLQVKKDAVNSLIQEIADKISDADTSVLKYPQVELMEVTRGSFRHTFDVQGIVEAEENILITPELPGLVKKINVREGAFVNKGDIILVLDVDVLTKNLEEVNTQLELATKLYNKQKALWDQKIGSEVQYLQAKTQKEALEKSIKTIRAQIDNANIKAPADGIIDDLTPKIGEMVSPPMPIARLVNLNSIYITSEVSERYLTSVRKNDSVLVKFPAIDKKILATINRVGTYINPDNRSFEISINVPNEENYLKPNLLAVLSLTDLARDSVVIVPSDYIQLDPDGEKYVFLAEEEMDESDPGKKIIFARKRLITEEEKANGWSWITNGLEEGDILVTEGFTTIVDGDRIEESTKKKDTKPEKKTEGTINEDKMEVETDEIDNVEQDTINL